MPEPSAPNPPTFNARRKLGVYALLGAIALAHAAAVVPKRELWPISHYPMYSRVYSTEWTTQQLAVVPAGVGAEEVVLPLRELPRPISVSVSLEWIARDIAEGRRPASDMHEALQWVESAWRKTPTGRRHAEAASVRLYALDWSLTRDNGRITVLGPERRLVGEWNPQPSKQPSTRPAEGGEP